MNLAKISRRRYTAGPTPIDYLPNLTKTINGPQIYIKRDDLLGLAGGGNKTRKLEFLVADALEKGADTLITCGAVQSNHCRLTAAVANKEGLRCHLVLEKNALPNTKQTSGNYFLDHLLGAQIHLVSNEANLQYEMEQVGAALTEEGHRVYLIPVGGSNPIGAIGYVACAEEILSQSFDLGISFDYLICTSGSAGTQAGLVAGLYGNNAALPVIGINISRAQKIQEDQVFTLANQTAAYLNIRGSIPRDSIICNDQYVGPGYALPTSAMIEAVRLVAQTEGILLDPVYTGKAMAGLLGLIREGFFSSNSKILFLHTGGAPALFTYQDVFEKLLV